MNMSGGFYGIIFVPSLKVSKNICTGFIIFMHIQSLQMILLKLLTVSLISVAHICTEAAWSTVCNFSELHTLCGSHQNFLAVKTEQKQGSYSTTRQ